MNIVSWNVNGINACAKKGLVSFMQTENADAYCFQEVKVSPLKLDKTVQHVLGYDAQFLFSEKKGRSGVVTYAKTKPLNIFHGIGKKEFDSEGRVLTFEFKTFFLVNAYFPHSNRELSRLPFKLEFNKAFEEFCAKLEKQKPVILAGDFNVAHEPIDLANPKQNEKNAGYTKEERNWFGSFLKKGFIDTFREFTKENGHYTWWTFRANARKRNIGWRIDYFLISQLLKNRLEKSEILPQIRGSDHCPIRLTINE
ncbi:MAG: exodeoxyribonuclease III [Candidatus Micrarchaeota archaeon]